VTGVPKTYSILIESLIDEDLNINIIIPQSLSQFMSVSKKEDILPAKGYIKWEWTIQLQDGNTFAMPVEGVIEVFADVYPTSVELELVPAGGLAALIGMGIFGLTVPTIFIIIVSLLTTVFLIRRERYQRVVVT